MFVGIDPGLKGALAFYDAVNDDLKVYDMPTHKVGKKTQVDVMGVIDHFCETPDKPIDLIVIEEVHSMPKDGVVSAFTFGMNVGLLQGAIRSLHMDFTTIRPSVWKIHYSLNRDKNCSIQKAVDQFPQFGHFFKRACDHGRAEAALLALYASDLFNLS